MIADSVKRTRWDSAWSNVKDCLPKISMVSDLGIKAILDYQASKTRTNSQS